MGFRRGLRLLWAVPVVGAALAAGWFFGARTAENSSLTEGPATAPARLEEGTGLGPEPLVEAETAEASVQSAMDEETKPIRADGLAAAAVGGAADGQNDELLDLVTSESRLVTARLAQEIAGLRSDLEDRAGRIRKRAADMPCTNGTGGAAYARPCVRLYWRKPLESGVQAQSN